MITLNQTIKNLSNIAAAHGQINSFGSGSVQDFACSGVTDYPAMWVDYEPAAIAVNNFYQRVRVYVCDRLLKGKRNEAEVLSDVQQTCLDIIAQCNSSIYGWKLDAANITLNQFSEPKLDDEDAGYYFDLSLKQAFTYDRCSIPFNSSILNPGTADTVTILDQDGNTIAVISSGNTYSVISVSGINGGNASTIYSNSIIQP